MTDIAAHPVPFHDVIGLAFHGFDADGDPRWRFDPTPDTHADEDPAYVHGGALAGCIEYVANHVVFERDTSGGYWMPLDMRVDFLALARPRPYAVVSQVVRIGRRSAVADARIEAWDDPSVVVASGRVAFTRIKDS